MAMGFRMKLEVLFKCKKKYTNFNGHLYVSLLRATGSLCNPTDLK